MNSDGLLLGRKTYELFAALWPSRGGALRDKLNSMAKYVASTTLEDPDWNNSTVLEGDVVGEVSRQRRELIGESLSSAAPSSRARCRLEHDLVDEQRLMVFPVVLGAGARLFGETSDMKPVRLVDTQTVGRRAIASSPTSSSEDAERASDGESLQDKRGGALRQAGIREPA